MTELITKTQNSLYHLISSVVHDFRNILSVLDGYGQLIQDDMDRARLYVDKIHETTNKSKIMVGNLLKFLKSKNNPNNCIRCYSIVAGMKEVMQQILGPGITLECAFEDTNSYVGISEMDLERLITNITLNAKDSMNGVGKFKISLLKKYFDQNWRSHGNVMRPGSYLVVRFEDNGSGISEENQAKIFSPFFTTKKDGNGLGLSSILSILSEAFGTIECFSKLGHGTRFDIYLPILQNLNHCDPKINEVQNAPIVQHNIILVEDSPEILDVFTNSLQRQGHVVNPFLNAEQAIQFLDKGDIQTDLLITDANLPGMNGDMIAEKFVSKVPGGKVIVVSGFEKERIASLFPEGCMFLTKPIQIKDLVAAVKNIGKHFA